MICLACSLLGGCKRAKEAGARAVRDGFGCDQRKLAAPLLLDAREEAMDRFGLSAVEGLLKTRPNNKETKDLMSDKIDIKADIEELLEDGAGYEEVHKHLMSTKADEGSGRKYRMFLLRDHALDLGMDNSDAMDGRRKPLIDFIASHYCGDGDGGDEEPEPEKKPKRRGGRRKKKDAEPEAKAEPEETPKKKRGRRRKKQPEPEPEPEPEAAEPEETEEASEPEPEEKPKKSRGRRKKAPAKKDEPAAAAADTSALEEKIDSLIDLVNNSGAATDEVVEGLEELRGELGDLADEVETISLNVKVISRLLQYKMENEDYEETEIEKVAKEAAGN